MILHQHSHFVKNSGYRSKVLAEQAIITGGCSMMASAEGEGSIDIQLGITEDNDEVKRELTLEISESEAKQLIPYLQNQLRALDRMRGINETNAQVGDKVELIGEELEIDEKVSILPGDRGIIEQLPCKGSSPPLYTIRFNHRSIGLRSGEFKFLSS